MNDIKKKVEEMSDFEMARWGSLIDAMDLISETAADKKQAFNDVDLKPLEINRYINGTCDAIAVRLTKERDKENVVRARS